jgi:Sap, sulfolipid-1-addressing protein
MGEVALLSLTAALNPTLLTATTVMLLLPSPRLLMLGYWIGAMLVSVTLGLVIVFALEGSGPVSTTKRTLSPAADLALGGIALVLAIVLLTGRDRALAERRARRREGRDPPKWQQRLSGGTARTTFVIGVLLTLPGASYLAGLTRLSKLDYSTPATVAAVLGFNLVMLVLLEAPLLAFILAPDRAEAAIERAKALVARHGRRWAGRGFAVVGALLVVKGIVGLAH